MYTAEHDFRHVEVRQHDGVADLRRMPIVRQTLDQDLQVLADQRIFLRRRPCSVSIASFVAAWPRSYSPGLRSITRSSKPSSPALATPSGLKLANSFRTNNAFTLLRSTQG